MRVKIGEEEYEVLKIDNVDQEVILQCVSRRIQHSRRIPLSALPPEFGPVTSLGTVTYVDETLEREPEGIDNSGRKVKHVKDATGKWVPTS